MAIVSLTGYYFITCVILFFVLKDYHYGKVYTPFFLITTAYLLIFLFGAVVFDIIRPVGNKIHLVPFIVNNLIALIFGMYLAKFRVLPHTRSSLQVSEYTTIKSKELLLMLAGLGVLASGFYFLRVGTVPLFSSDADTAKVQALAGSGYIRIFMLALPVICLFLWYDYLIKPSRQQKIITYGIIIVSILIEAFSGSRSRIVILVSELAIIYLIVHKKKLSLAKGFMVLLFLYAVLVVLGAYRHFNGVVTYNHLISELITIISARAASLDNIVQRADDLLMGKTFLFDLRKILPGQQTGLGVFVKEKYFNSSLIPDKAGINTTVLGEMFINFGHYGTTVAMVIYGYVAQKLYLILVSLRTRETIVLYAILIMTLVTALQTAIGPHLPNVIYAMIWFSVITFLAKKRITGFLPSRQKPSSVANHPSG